MRAERRMHILVGFWRGLFSVAFAEQRFQQHRYDLSVSLPRTAAQAE
jgi:hypothetical protein